MSDDLLLPPPPPPPQGSDDNNDLLPPPPPMDAPADDFGAAAAPPPPPPGEDPFSNPLTAMGGSTTETTTLWEFLFPEVQKETAKASANVREDLSNFLKSYAENLDDLYQAIDQNPCRTWGVSSTPIGLQYPFPTSRTIDEFFETHDDELIYSVKLLTQYITYIQTCETKVKEDYYKPLAVFGELIDEIPLPHEALDTECGIPTGDLEEMTAKIIPILHKLATFLPEFYAVGQKFVEYILFLYSPQNKFFKQFFQNTILASAFSAIGVFMRILYTLTTLISDNPALSDGWDHLRKMFFGIRKEPGNYNTTTEDVTQAEPVVMQITRVLFNQSQNLVGLFINAVSQLAGHPAAKNFGTMLEKYLDDEVSIYIRHEKNVDAPEQEPNICNLTLLLHFLTVFKRNPRNRIVSNIWNSYQQAAIVKLYHFVSFSPIQYLQDNVLDLVRDAVGDSTIRGTQKKLEETLAVQDSTLAAACMRIFAMFSQWQAVCQTQLVRGLDVAYFLRSVITRTIDLHSSLGKPLDMTHTEHLGRMIELLKAIHTTFFLNQSAILHNLPRSVDTLINSFREQLKKVGTVLRKRAYKPYRSVASNILNLALHCVRSFSSEYSIPCLEVLADLFSSKVLSGLPFTREEIIGRLRQVQLLNHYTENIDQACNTSFLVDSPDLYGIFLKFIKNEPRRVIYLAMSMNDVAEVVKSDQELYKKFEDYFIKTLRNEFIQPVLSQIETELRFHTHEHLAVSERNPLKKQFNSFDKFLTIPPFKMVTKFIDIQFEACYYFTRVFYNETTIAPQVWETYAEMANMANRLYGIKILDCHIPGAMMQQDIDVLEIMRNINVFVACYNYDLNSQVFVQRAEDSHHVSIVGIPHIFSSYRCHGIGIMNTTVDFTYRFLRMKFNVFSKFLFDDTVKSRLINECGWFEQNKDEINGQFPYARAEKLVTDMKRITGAAQNLSPLDHFRILITEIGNALGFVRTVRNGGTRFLNNAIGFVYDEDENLSFHDFAEEVQLPQATTDATARLDSVVGKLKELFNSEESFFKMLVDVFATAFRDKKNAHLQLFYAIIPALTLSYIDHIMVLKDKAMKQNKNASFSDDGFPLGIAYILKLLDQDASFDTLHWFDSLKAHAATQREEAANNSKKSSFWQKKNDPTNTKQTLKLTLQMIERQSKEYELLETTVHSARILFN
ncbi:WASH complex subunit 7-like [Tritrichomonas foetus]|uniref:WASH complex subunit 7-like n=1 Tax=Tritrichomonas foetus TaxID=1144522 RepID=A0A1J4JFY5_9EUKA|nr:WASH complex subunit 7-like [Tritrichomonas foetus]|eukprot:OHS96547.1 WASH complex subunit 7-like [Tritrichomonas foetus]